MSITQFPLYWPSQQISSTDSSSSKAIDSWIIFVLCTRVYKMHWHGLEPGQTTIACTLVFRNVGLSASAAHDCRGEAWIGKGEDYDCRLSFCSAEQIGAQALIELLPKEAEMFNCRIQCTDSLPIPNFRVFKTNPQYGWLLHVAITSVGSCDTYILTTLYRTEGIATCWVFVCKFRSE